MQTFWKGALICRHLRKLPSPVAKVRLNARPDKQGATAPTLRPHGFKMLITLLHPEMAFLVLLNPVLQERDPRFVSS